MDDIRSGIIREARTWIGTPWLPSGARKGAGCNCLGFIVGVARNCGLDLSEPFRNYEGYALPPKPLSLLRGLREQMLRTRNPEPGDVLLFDLDGLRHVAFLTEPGRIIHAHQSKGKVTEHRMIWRPHSAYRVPA